MKTLVIIISCLLSIAANAQQKSNFQYGFDQKTYNEAITNSKDMQLTFDWKNSRGQLNSSCLAYNEGFVKLAAKNLEKDPIYLDNFTEVIAKNSHEKCMIILTLTMIKGQETDRNKIAENIISFVQTAIKYDDSKKGSTNLIINSPSQTLVKGKGNCSDKATLLYLLLREAGFGVCLFSDENHVLVGIACESKFAFDFDKDGQAYCLVESTSPHAISFSTDAKEFASAKYAPKSFKVISKNNEKGSRLGTQQMTEAKQGLKYTGFSVNNGEIVYKDFRLTPSDLAKLAQ